MHCRILYSVVIGLDIHAVPRLFRTAEVNVRDANTVVESGIPNGSQSLGQSHVFQRHTVLECVHIHLGEIFRKSDGFQTGAALEKSLCVCLAIAVNVRIRGQCRQVVRKLDADQTGAVLEHAAAHFCNRLGHGEIRQNPASGKRRIVNLRDGLRDGDVGKRRAVFKGSFADACGGVGQGDFV